MSRQQLRRRLVRMRRPPSEGGMSYSPTSPASSPRGQDDPESTEDLLPGADDGRQPGRADDDQDAARAGLASRNSDERGHKRRPSRQAAGERASSSTRTNPQAQEDSKRRSDGDDDDRYDPTRDIDVGVRFRRETIGMKMPER